MTLISLMTFSKEQTTHQKPREPRLLNSLKIFSLSMNHLVNKIVIYLVEPQRENLENGLQNQSSQIFSILISMRVMLRSFLVVENALNLSQSYLKALFSLQTPNSPQLYLITFSMLAIQVMRNKLKKPEMIFEGMYLKMLQI